MEWAIPSGDGSGRSRGQVLSDGTLFPSIRIPQGGVWNAESSGGNQRNFLLISLPGWGDGRASYDENLVSRMHLYVWNTQRS